MTISLESVGFAYETAGRSSPMILRNIDLTIAEGEFLILLGPSGCGKSTLLRLVAGFDHASEGRLQIDGKPISGPGKDRGMVFQDLESALYEWLTVRENVEFGLQIDGVPRQERIERRDAALKMVNLLDHGDKFPDALSGGMKQRVQIARMLAMRPSIMLMDEPFASLDAQTRQILQNQMVSIWTEVGGTAIYVTHDIREALNLGQRIILMSAGPAANIKHSYDVPMDYPRKQSDPLYIDLLERISADIEEEVSKVWQ
ncbi:MAG: ABC transporter ATP-binding protein [Alphaproteobacteria bacterium]|nr:ABC transporter ATP-binding protein [Alphaproteobacteria bacterium]